MIKLSSLTAADRAELNARVEREVFEQQVACCEEYPQGAAEFKELTYHGTPGIWYVYDDEGVSYVRDFLRDGNAMLELIEQMCSLGYRYVMRGNFEGNGQHWAAFDHQEWADANPLYQSGSCDSEQLAVVLAALQAMKGEQECISG